VFITAADRQNFRTALFWGRILANVVTELIRYEPGRGYVWLYRNIALIVMMRSMNHRKNAAVSRVSTYVIRLLLVIASYAFVSCSGEERIINDISSNWNLLVATNQTPANLAIVHQTDNVLTSNDVFSAANGAPLVGSVSKIVEFDSLLYLLMPDVKLIEVISRNTFKRVASISTVPHRVVDLCFANATTAYSANDDSTISIIDVTIYKLLLGRDIAINAPATAIAALGNQIGLLIPSRNELSILDSRSNTITRVIALAPAPAYIHPDARNMKFHIVCLGHGKSATDTVSEFSAGHLVSYDIVQKKITGDVVLTEFLNDSPSLVPHDFVVTNSGIIYVMLETEIKVFDGRILTMLGNLNVTTVYDMAYYDSYRSNAVFVSRGSGATSAVLIVELDGAKIDRVLNLPVGARSAIVL
jgi:hypothetical protein